MSDEPAVRVAPRIEAEAVAAPRLEPESLPAVVSPPLPRSGLGLVLGGGAILLGGLVGLDLATTIAGLFDRSPWLGAAGAAVGVAGVALMARGLVRELRGLASLAAVDRLRSALAGNDMATARREARAWAGRVGADRKLDAALVAAPDVSGIAALLRAGPAAELATRADALGRTAAIQAFLATAASPSAALDAIIVIWRGVRLIREVATLYGMRPGAAAMLRLVRRTALSAASVAGTDLVAHTIARGLLTHPLARHVGGELPAATLVARRMVLLARATAAACSPLGEAGPPGAG